MIAPTTVDRADLRASYERARLCLFDALQAHAPTGRLAVLFARVEVLRAACLRLGVAL